MLHTLPQAVDRAAERDPDHEAVRCDGEALTYSELAEGAARLARVFADQGVRRGDRVGLYADKSLRTTMAMYGAMRAGAAYVPIDPSAPVARVSLILDDCDIRHVVADPPRAHRLGELLSGGVSLDGVVGLEEDIAGVHQASWQEVDAAPSDAIIGGPSELDLSYVLYTSGSTGVPKGVMHTHRSALSWAEVSARTWNFQPDDRLSSHAPLYFDLSTLDYFASAVAGATTVIVPAAHTRLPASFSQLIQDERLTVLFVVPLALTHLLLHGALDERDTSAVRWVLFGGEPFPVKHLRGLMAAMPGAHFSNVYGPTEVNGITYWNVSDLPATDDAQIPIGDAFDNVELIVADEAGEAVEDGESGELLARTPTMMRGYWRRPDLNARAFWSRTAAGGYEEVFHRTGDLVRRREDGLLDFLGRRDRQVKVRGHRVELDEVEAVLTAHEEVENAGVFVVPTEDGSQRVLASVTIGQGASTTSRDLLRHASESLPRYALPEVIEITDVLPRTVTGKIDRGALREAAMKPLDE